MADQPHVESTLKFFDQWNTDFPTMCASFHTYFAKDAIWWNTPIFPQVQGVEEAYEQILRPSNESSLAMDRIHVETLNIAQVGNLVLEGLGGRGLLRCRPFQAVDVSPKRGDLGSRRFVRLFEILDASHQGLVAGDLVGGRKELGLDLARNHEPRRERNGRHDEHP